MRTILFPFALLLASSLFAQSKPIQERYDNGRMKSTRFTVDGVDHFMTYYASGRLKETGKFRNGRRDGVWEQFAENGTLLARACFRDGLRSGTWEIRDARNGSMGRLTYHDGSLSSSEQYDAANTMVASRSY